MNKIVVYASEPNDVENPDMLKRAVGGIWLQPLFTLSFLDGHKLTNYDVTGMQWTMSIA
jgi:hypothetical protein